MKSKQAKGRWTRVPYRMTIAGWWDILRRLVASIGERNISILAAGVAFYSLLAMFPALAAIVSTYALLADPQTVTSHLASAQSFLPADVSEILDQQLSALSSRPTEGLSLKLVAGVLLALWSAHKGVDALTRAIGVAYQEPETRGFLKLNLLTYLMTAGAVLFVVVVLVLLVVLPSITALLPLPEWWNLLVPVLRWLMFVAVVSLAIALLYRVAPARRPAKWRWLSIGAVVATLMWLSGSALFSFYVSQFGTYNETYGTLGAIVVLLLWLFISSYALIIGAVLNAELEHQTRVDTTRGPERAMGERGAVVADTIAPSPDA